MKHTRKLLLLLSGLVVIGQTVFAAPRSPLPPWPEMALARERFDEPYSMATNAIDPTMWAESWSGYALNRQSRKVEAWLMPMVGADKWNIAPVSGTIRFWFRPGWSSQSALGGGPGCLGRLLEMTGMGSGKPVTRWALYLTADGNAVCLGGETAAGMADILSAPICWSQDQWHLVALGYSPTNTTLCIDGVCVAQGAGILPPTLAEVSGLNLVIGSDPAGRNVVVGQIDELTTFQRELQAFEVAVYYTGTAPTAALGPFVSVEAEQARRLSTALASSSASMMTLDAGVPPPPGGGGGGGTNEPPFYYPPVTNGLRMTIQVTNGIQLTVLCETNALFDLFCTTNLLGDSITDSTWYWLGQVTNTQVYVMETPPFQNATNLFFVLGGPADGDGDELTTAYETLASKTDPNSYSNPDTDQDGMPDLWEMKHGLKPQFDDSQLDANGDGIVNIDEYRLGNDPQSAGVFDVWVAQPLNMGVIP